MRLFAALVVAVVLTACGSAPARLPPSGTGYGGPGNVPTYR